MTQYIGQPNHVLAGVIKGFSKQMAQIVWEYLGWFHPRQFAQSFHFGPDLAPGQTFSVSCEKDLTGNGFLRLRVFQQLAAKLVRNENRADLSFQRDVSSALTSGFYGDIPHFGYPDPCSADSLHEQSQSDLTLLLCDAQQAFVFRPPQLST